jgi:quinol-cytochrome oxidoreductase complex cytochrome b subunit
MFLDVFLLGCLYGFLGYVLPVGQLSFHAASVLHGTAPIVSAGYGAQLDVLLGMQLVANPFLLAAIELLAAVR